MNVARSSLVTLAAPLLLACAAEPPDDTTAPDRAVATVSAPATDAPAPAPAADTTSFAAFWPRFRAAALAGDTAAVADLTRFPFRTRGQSDDDPVVEHDRRGFPALLGRLLAQDPGLGRDRPTMRALLDAAGRVDTAGEPPDEVAVGDFVFERAGGRWRFVHAYTNP